MSLIYAFFIVFLAIMFAVLADYANNRILTSRLNNAIINEENYKLEGYCGYNSNAEIFSANNSDGSYKTGIIRLSCSGYYYVEMNSISGESSDNFNGGKGASASSILYLDRSTIIQYVIGIEGTALKVFLDERYEIPISTTSGTDATNEMAGINGDALIDQDKEYVLEPTKGLIDTASAKISIKYLGSVLENT